MYYQNRGGPPRLQGYDYTSCGHYFVTINVKDMIPYFGRIIDKKHYLNVVGKVVEDTWIEIPSKFSNVVLDIFIVMPEHFHGIISITERRSDLERFTSKDIGGVTGIKNPMIVNGLGAVVRWFKARCTRQIREYIPEFNWLPRYFDVVIWNQTELNRIRRYILTNPHRYEGHG